MTAQSFASLGTAAVLVGHENIIRISPSVSHGRFGLDVVKGTQSLKGLGASEARKYLPIVRPIFFENPAEQFEPYRKLDDCPGLLS